MSQKTKPRNTRKTNPSTAHRSPAQGINPMMHPDAAGIDVGAEEFVVAAAPGRLDADQPAVLTFTTFTSGVEALRDWLLACGIKTAAMEPKPRGRGADRLRRRSSPAGVREP